MTTATHTMAPIQTTDAAFRANVIAVLAAIDSILTRTGDTGQINTATVVRASTNTAAGYAMWRINGGTQDIFMKIEFGTASFSQNPAWWVTFGTATNGSGTLSGAMFARTGLGVTSAVSTTYDCLYSGDTGRFAMTIFANNGTTVNDIFMISIERDWDAVGASNEAYYYAVFAMGGSDKWNRCVKVSGDIFGLLRYMPGSWPPDGASHLLGLDVCCYPVRPRYGTERNPSKNWIVIGNSDAAYGTVFTADIYSAAAVWVKTFAQATAGTGSDTNNRTCMRFE